MHYYEIFWNKKMKIVTLKAEANDYAFTIV